MKLSVLCCSIVERLPSRMISQINEQIQTHNLRDEVELIYLGDAMHWTIGEKRQKLLELAGGDFVAFVDDDDQVADNYVLSLYRAIRDHGEEVDSITFILKYMPNGRPVYYTCNAENEDLSDKYIRRTNHICAIRKDLALAAGFSDKQFGEDTEFAYRLKLKTEFHVPKILYYYDFNKQTSRSHPHHRYNGNNSGPGGRRAYAANSRKRKKNK